MSNFILNIIWQNLRDRAFSFRNPQKLLWNLDFLTFISWSLVVAASENQSHKCVQGWTKNIGYIANKQ